MTTTYQQANKYHDAYKGMPKRHPHNKELTLCYESYFKKTEINTSKGPMVVEYMNGLIDTYLQHKQQYAKVFSVMINLYFPSNTSLEYRVHQDYFKRFMASLNAQLDTHMKHKRAEGDGRSNKVRFCRVYEEGNDRGLHIHAVLFFNGHTFRTLGDFNSTQVNLYHRIVGAWASALGMYACQVIQEGLIYFSHGGYLIDTNDANKSQVAKNMFQHYSYICKAYSKRYNLPIKVFSRSRG